MAEGGKGSKTLLLLFAHAALRESDGRVSPRSNERVRPFHLFPPPHPQTHVKDAWKVDGNQVFHQNPQGASKEGWKGGREGGSRGVRTRFSLRRVNGQRTHPGPPMGLGGPLLEASLSSQV